MSATRRSLLRAAGATGLLSAAGLPLRASAQSPITVGVIYVGPRDDFGYNQAQAQAAAGLKKMAGVKVVEEEKVPETVAVQKTMEAMISQDKASLIFATSFGYFDPHMLRIAEKYPNVRFAHCGGLWTEGKHPKNTGSYFGYIDGAQYVAGVVAGHMSRKKKLGFIAAKPIPQVLRNLNAFTLGARSVDPSITTQVIFTGDWSLPVKEAEAANSLIDQGVDVLTCHVDSPKVVVETAELPRADVHARARAERGVEEHHAHRAPGHVGADRAALELLGQREQLVHLGDRDGVRGGEVSQGVGHRTHTMKACAKPGLQIRARSPSIAGRRSRRARTSGSSPASPGPRRP